MRNTNENVRICITGEPCDIEQFLVALRRDAPPASLIADVSVQETETEEFAAFNILLSKNVSDEITGISPDIAVCSECMADIEAEGNRQHYAFVNCTNCGPRFSIIRDLPYDRAQTTMKPFTMCPDCRKEFESVADRRFHAQPVACERCGPRYELMVRGKMISDSTDTIVDYVAGSIDHGGIVLVKGLGGMHLACDAFQEAAAGKLRDVKRRDGKPFAVMFRDVESLRRFAVVDKTEERSLLSWRRPVVLLEMKNRRDKDIAIAENINTGLGLIGAFLPYLPFHYLLFRHLSTPAIVLTSGNFSSEPILIHNRDAMLKFSESTDAMVLHDRDIFNRTDDSVVRIAGDQERIFRRSRGYAPAPFVTSLDTDGIVAFGAELANCFCIGKGQQAIMSQHIGDLQDLETVQFYEQTIEKFLKLFRVKPSLLAVDMHPDYVSAKTGRDFGDLPLVTVQHHHAHIASCMTEHRIDETVIGVAFDGTGYGDDGNTWGSEFLVCSLSGYDRITHFEYLPLPGGDMAAEEPWRMAVSWLYKVYGNDFTDLKLPFFGELEPGKVRFLAGMIDRKINCPLTCGAGRMFDAVASILGLCQAASFQAEGPMRLESMVMKGCRDSYGFEMEQTIGFDATLRGIVEDVSRGIDPAIIATKFHNTIVSVIFENVISIRRKTAINKVMLSGGVFQNKYLLEGTMNRLKEQQVEVYTHAAVPAGDGGIALGQLAIASKRRSLKCV